MLSNKSIWVVVGFLALLTVGVTVIPPLMKKYSNKLYKASIQKDQIDIDSLGPEIVKKNSDQEEK